MIVQLVAACQMGLSEMWADQDVTQLPCMGAMTLMVPQADQDITVRIMVTRRKDGG